MTRVRTTQPTMTHERPPCLRNPRSSRAVAKTTSRRASKLPTTSSRLHRWQRTHTDKRGRTLLTVSEVPTRWSSAGPSTGLPETGNLPSVQLPPYYCHTLSQKARSKGEWASLTDARYPHHPRRRRRGIDSPRSDAGAYPAWVRRACGLQRRG